MNELISIIVPCYNADKTLARAIDSVRQQDYKNLEIILVNDGSCDNTLAVATKYANIDSRIKVLNQDNAGVSVARNNGLKVATGEYIMYLDADDNYTTPYAITNMMKKLHETGADLCVCNFIHPCFEQYISGGVYDMTNDNDFIIYYQDGFASGVPWNKIYRRECITEDFSIEIKFTEDFLFNLDNLHNLKKVVVIDDIYYNYYCAPYNPNASASLVNSIYTTEKFIGKKRTGWHLTMQYYDYMIDSIKNFLPEKLTEMQYIRSFDSFFGCFSLMAKNFFNKLITDAVKEIFKEDLFIKSLKDKERYGLKLRNYNETDIEKFVKIAYISFRNIKIFNHKLSISKTLLGLFGYFFYCFGDNVNMVDILASTYSELIDNASKEAIYTNNLIKRFITRI